MKIIFWNIKKKDLVEEIFDLIQAELPDILILCECEIGAKQLLLKLNSIKTLYNYIPTKASNIKVFTFFSDKFVTVSEDSNRYSIFKITLPLREQFLLVPLHLPDKGNWGEISPKYECVAVSNSINDIEDKLGVRQTIVVGDFNMNPFEEGMISTMGFHATRNKEIAFKKRRKVQGKLYKFFYNPMWKFYNNTQNPAGTFYYWSSTHVCYFWNLFDQIIFRPELISKFDENNLTIISKFKQHHLIKGNGMISESYSDHLPIKAEFNI